MPWRPGGSTGGSAVEHSLVGSGGVSLSPLDGVDVRSPEVNSPTERLTGDQRQVKHFIIAKRAADGQLPFTAGAVLDERREQR